MPKIFIIPHYHYEADFADFLRTVNHVQSHFEFHLLSLEQQQHSPLKKNIADYTELLAFLLQIKEQNEYAKEDLLIAFYDGIITANDHGYSNLFIAGANADDPYPHTAVISLKFIFWGILEEKYNYSVQRHALFHLVISSLIASYTKLQAHFKTYGCLLDFNGNLLDFNKKIQMGYYLCSSEQDNCYNRMLEENYGKAIIKLCSELKKLIDPNINFEELNTLNFFVEIRDTLMELSNNINEIRAIVISAGIQPEFINLNESAYIVWTNTVERAQKEEKIFQLLQEVKKINPNNKKLKILIDKLQNNNIRK